jgi:ATP-dependent DNA helicase RecQ
MGDNYREYGAQIDDYGWDSLFEMADEYVDEEDYDYDDLNGLNEVELENRIYNTPEEALKVLFGYDSFRTGQREIIDAILSGKDVFAVMPTGAGKSLCYQIPSMILSGMTLVVSPLISLMQDQVKALKEAGVSAAFINSALSEKSFNDVVQKAMNGKYKVLYVAPERLMNEDFINLAKHLTISMVTVDEAHCISQWGQDFRPSYTKIVEFVKLLDKRPIISAFTATATENVREDIVCTLGLKNPYALVLGFDRENLFFQVERPKNKDQYIEEYISEHADESGIIYCSTRKNVDKLYDMLLSKGINVAKYHAGMEASERKQMQDDFVFDYKSIIVATNAFGMGIDKSNVRFVIHYNMPQSMENYYQEAGRAGRDGLDSKCILLFSPQDIIINKFLLEHKENIDLDPADYEMIRERDNQRLQLMEKYCYTTECLRNYILKYFGEKPIDPCGDCGNCIREFETVDMTDAAKKIINCVYEAKGRYGKGIIVDTVLGAKTARLKEVGAVNFRSYGVLNSISKNMLMRLVEQLIIEKYLLIGEYQVLKIGDISSLKEEKASVMVRITDEDKRPARTPKKDKKSVGMSALTSNGFKLFDKLRELRLEIAREESMPPYIIFNDKTLIEMSARIPTSEAEMLKISGVGENKLKKYGERFLKVIEECCTNTPDLLADRFIDDASFVEEKVSGKSKSKTKQEFNLLVSEADNYDYSDYKLISEIRDEMNSICERDNIKKLPATRLTEILMDMELIVEDSERGRYGKSPTEKGERLGIQIEQRVSEKGNSYSVLKYSPEIQKLLVEHFIR